MIKILIFTFLYLILNASAFSKNTTIKNLESCLKNQSELITDETKKEICIQKHSSNIPIDIIKIIRAELSFNNDALFLHVEFKNISTDYIITDLNIDFHHEIDYGSQKGVLHLQQSYNKDLGWSGFWVEPLQTDNISMDIYGYPQQGYTARSDLISSHSTVSKDFEIKIDKIKKNGDKWTSNIISAKGFQLK